MPAVIKKSQTLKLMLAAVLLAGAAFMFRRFLRSENSVSEQTFFYDLSEKKLFAVSREAIPPIRGLNDNEEDAVRAVVVANGDAKNAANRRIAYLEKYAPDLKKHLEKVRAGQAEPLPRGQRDGFRLVKRLADADWHPVNTPEGGKILSEWNVPGPDGRFPVVCAP